MSKAKTPQLYSRKAPQQARSAELVGAILTAAVQVLDREGAERFTMKRVAERAGVSVGSLYQYFPNKAAILFRLQCDEWRETTGALLKILDDEGAPASERMRALVFAYIRSEVAEAPFREALGEEAPGYRALPEREQTQAEALAALERFVDGLCPRAPTGERALIREVIATTLSSLGETFSRQPRTSGEVEAYAAVVAEMLGVYTAHLDETRRVSGVRENLLGNKP
ncbi:TetR family transcriptional regulator [Pseudenhygromyxa sp. WMMC2535]|uniref:TetR family transcriptional regulator n=1 Tax=Pseudenhygromyxa sp. WMMC2535 TaxID=2712867 RepID=UPI001554E8DA|nr:TetR family transcriptional regulator [Pseudenhygromyxa sp. WMMC2535]NVB37938.1 TetR family transcriptional regulator [Pseudenhygromyxa sp. WMMC2535]